MRSGSVTTAHLIFFVVSAAAPLTVMAGFAPLAFMLGGQSSPVGYLVAGVTYLIFAVGFTTMSRYVRNAGAFYAYITHGLGRIVGAGAAVLAYVGYVLAEIGFAAAAGLFASTTLQSLAGITVGWIPCAVFLLLLVTLVSWSRVDVGARVLAVLLICEVTILVVLCVAILISGTPEGLTLEGFNPATWSPGAMASLFVITFMVYVGFEQTAVYSEEAKDPRRTIPRATYLAVAILAVIYSFVSWALLMAIGPSNLAAALEGDHATLVFSLSQQYAGTALTQVMEVLMVTSIFAGVLAVHNAGSRYLFALGREGLLPKILSHTRERTSSPGVAVIVHAVLVMVPMLVLAFAGLDPYSQIVIWTNTPGLVSVLLLQLLTSVAVISYFARNPRGERSWNRLVAPAIASVLLCIVIFLVCSQMDLLTGLSLAGNLAICVPLLLAFLTGVAFALRLRATRPDDYACLGARGPQATGHEDTKPKTDAQGDH
uniref:APC family permease n=1 Tax=Epidermidibacterium keratini TaxID=1891644 RepID=UPI00384F7EB9